MDVKTKENSPFATKLEEKNLTTAGMGCDKIKDALLKRECESYKYDSFKLYPNNYLLDDGRIYFTREGDWVSLRYGNTKGLV